MVLLRGRWQSKGASQQARAAFLVSRSSFSLDCLSGRDEMIDLGLPTEGLARAVGAGLLLRTLIRACDIIVPY